MSRAETGRALLRAFADAARMIASGYDPKGTTRVDVMGRASRRSQAYQRGLMAALATAYGS